MKFLIWLSCYAVCNFLITLLSRLGVTLGGIPTLALYLGTFFLAKYLCRKWQEHQKEKAAEKAEKEENTEERIQR